MRRTLLLGLRARFLCSALVFDAGGASSSSAASCASPFLSSPLVLRSSLTRLRARLAFGGAAAASTPSLRNTTSSALSGSALGVARFCRAAAGSLLPEGEAPSPLLTPVLLPAPAPRLSACGGRRILSFMAASCL